jgi:hypothetical protein
MFFKIWAFAILIVALALQTQAHAAVAPVLGVAGAPKRSDVKRPSAANPCGAGVNIAGTIDKSTAVQAAADGSFEATAIDFNAYVNTLRVCKMPSHTFFLVVAVMALVNLQLKLMQLELAKPLLPQK